MMDDVTLLTLIFKLPFGLHCIPHAYAWCLDILQILWKPSHLIHRRAAARILRKLLRKGTWLKKKKREISGNKRQEKEEGGICAWHELFESGGDFEVRMNCARWKEDCGYEIHCIHQVRKTIWLSERKKSDVHPPSVHCWQDLIWGIEGLSRS